MAVLQLRSSEELRISEELLSAEAWCKLSARTMQNNKDGGET